MQTLNSISRREFCSAAAAVAVTGLSESSAKSEPTTEPFQLHYVLASAMYGTTSLAEILPEVHKTGAAAIDLWPRVHGNQREQVASMGEQAFQVLLNQNRVRLGVISQYRLGPFGLQKEMRFAARMGGPGTVLIAGGSGPTGLRGTELKSAVSFFAEKMKSHLAVAAETGTIVAIENHGHNLIDSPDSIKWLCELSPSPQLGIAIAPHHLPQDADLIATLITDLGSKVAFFYAQQHGKGSSKKMPKREELLQMPGRGKLNFVPILAALKKIGYQGLTEIFMHPTPRGIPILESTVAVTQEINRARGYLTRCCQKI
jgi:sugar phosphate isomerase/epimerase